MSPTTTCPRCTATLEPGARTCPGCGFDVAWDQQGVTTAAMPELPQLPQPIELLRQATVGEYEILAELGSGGMATVFLGHDLTLGRKVAIKWMSPSLLHGPGLVERFKREARTAGALSHPHIIPIYAVKEEAAALYFVMKYVPGRPLDSIIRELGALPLPMIRSILSEVGAAIDYAHRQGVIHRDVKPSNIMIDEEGFAVITDFGIAKAIDAEGLTQTGTTVGTPSFLSPEACTGKPVTAAADQYALGVVAYQLLTGQLPFTGASGMAIMYAHVHAAPRPPAELRPDCPTEASAAVLKMLAKEPDQRWPSVKDAVAALAAALPPADDAVRLEIGGLAKRRDEPGSLPTHATPASPIVASRRTAPSEPSDSAPRPAGGVSRLWIATTAAALLVAIWFALSSHQQPATADSRAATSAPVSQPDDSLYVAAHAAASFARQRAVAGGVGSRELATGDSLQRLGDSLAALGHKANAAVLLTNAASLWSAAEHAAAGGQAVPIVSKPAAPKPPLNDSETVAKFYDDLAHAIAARQLGEVQRLRSNMTASEERNWRGLFDDQDVTRIEASFTVLKITRQEETAYASIASTLNLTRKGKLEQKMKRQNVTLTLGPEGWREIRAEDVK